MSEAADALQHADRNVSRDEDHRFPPKRNDAGEREPRTTTSSRIHVRQRAQTPECHAWIGLDSTEAMGSENSFVTNGFGDRPVDERELGADHVRIVLRRQRRQGCAPPQVIVSGIGHRAPRKGVLAMDDEGGRERRRPTERMHVDQVAGPAAYLLPSGERGKRRTRADPTGSASCLPAPILPRVSGVASSVPPVGDHVCARTSVRPRHTFGPRNGRTRRAPGSEHQCEAERGRRE